MELTGYPSMTPLHYACYSGASADVVRVLLLADPGAACKPMLGSGYLPLHEAKTKEIAQMLLNAYPGGVTIRAVNQHLPLHNIAFEDSVPHDVVDLLVTEGQKWDVGGKSGGGGVFTSNLYGLSPLSEVCSAFRTAANRPNDKHEPPRPLSGRLLGLWEKMTVILRAAYHASMPGGGGGGITIKEKDSIQARGTWSRKEMANDNNRSIKSSFPFLHATIALKCPSIVLRYALHMYPKQIMEVDEEGRVPLAVAAMTNASLETIRFLLYSKQHGCARAAQIFDHEKRLPLHHGIVNGMTFSEGLEMIFLAWPIALQIPDGKTGLYPFMVAAVDDMNHIDVVYRLLRECPSLVNL